MIQANAPVNEQSTVEFDFPLYALSGDGDDRKNSPLGLEIDLDNGECYGVLFTSKELATLFFRRKNTQESLREIPNAKEMKRIGHIMMECFGNIKRVALNPSGGPGMVQFLEIRDLMHALRGKSD